jgi:hypothetical protein
VTTQIPPLAPLSALVRGVFTSAIGSLSEPVQRTSRRNAWDSVRDDRMRARARAEAMEAVGQRYTDGSGSSQVIA